MKNKKEKEKNIDNTELNNGVDLKSNKKSHLKKEEKEKNKEIIKEKKAIKKKKKEKVQKSTTLGFRTRLSLGFLIFVLIFTGLLYLFMYLNTRLERLRDGRVRALELARSWVQLASVTKNLVASSTLDKDRFLLDLSIVTFQNNLNSVIQSQIIEDENILKKHNRLFEFTLSLLKSIGLNRVFDISIFEDVAYTKGYQNQFKLINSSWKEGLEKLDKIKNGFFTDPVIQLRKEKKPLLIKEAELIRANESKNSEVIKLLRNIEDFISFSELFSSSLTQANVYLEKNIDYSINRINFIITSLTTFVSIMAFIFTVFVSVFLQKALINPLKRIIQVTDKVGSGDLTGSIKVERRDEIGTLTNAFNTTVTDLKTLIQQINIAIIVITRTLTTLFKSSNDVKESANAQATTIENTRENFATLDSMIKTISEETKKAANFTEEALSKTQLGLQSIGELENEMNKIETSSEEITDIIGLINYISEQTSLLSINASIEAARAGEYGKGFSVVANEIKQLADRSAQFANRIYELISYNSKIIQDGVNLSRNTADLLRQIAESTKSSAGIVKTINDESNNIYSNSNEILGVINYIAEVAQVNLIEIENVANATVDLGDQSVNLQRFIGQFDARSSTIKENQQHIEDILQNKLEMTRDIIKTLGDNFLPTGNTIEVKTPRERYIAEELQIGDSIVTYNNDFVDSLSKKTNTAISFFQKIGSDFVTVSTTLQNYDTTRALGTIIDRESEIYKQIINKGSFYGRFFIVNRWYISVYDPIIGNTGDIVGCINLAIAEEIEKVSDVSKEALQKDVIEEGKKVLTA